MNNVMAKLRSGLVFSVGLISFGASLTSQGAVAVWDFSTPTTGPLTSYSASSQDGLLVSGTPALSSSGGTIVPSATGGVDGVLSYSFKNGEVGGLNGAAFTLTIQALTGFSVQNATYAVAFNNKVTSLTGTWSYQIDGGSTTTLGNETISDGPNSDTLGISGIALAANEVLALKFTLSGATADPGYSSLTFDNLTINAVPEPTNVAFAIFGLGVVGFSAGRRLYGRKRA